MSVTDEYLRSNAAYAERGFVFDVSTGKLNEVS